MVRPWQFWLSPRPLHRTNISEQAFFHAAGDATRFDIIIEDDGRWGLREMHDIKSPMVKAGLSGPPLHIHLLQDEFFKVEQGILAASLDGVVSRVTKDDDVLCIPAGTRHRFWSDQSSTESLIFHGWAHPQDKNNILDENFLRNLQGYLADCHNSNLEPSLFQLILFAYNASTLLTPPFWVPLKLLTILHYVSASWIAEGLLGYEPSYPEYSAKPKTA
ncbi:hypothetical protein EKO27_g6372 [Xylaria grammica]|uniref:Uncharacterized protein n=1 Tax=Xylaria grammica TaxID=363999 RepID=A0A439D2S9_9PEZI|nr:hypothetical protein EKO27_g6372 [Xylaria grammica]